MLTQRGGEVKEVAQERASQDEDSQLPLLPPLHCLWETTHAQCSSPSSQTNSLFLKEGMLLYPFSEGDAKVELLFHILNFIYTIGRLANYCLLRSRTRSRAYVGEASHFKFVYLSCLHLPAGSDWLVSLSVIVFPFVCCSRNLIRL